MPRDRAGSRRDASFAKRPTTQKNAVTGLRRQSTASTLMKFKFALMGATRKLIDKKRAEIILENNNFLNSPFRLKLLAAMHNKLKNTAIQMEQDAEKVKE